MKAGKNELGSTDFQTALVIFGGNVPGWTIDENTSLRPYR